MEDEWTDEDAVEVEPVTTAWHVTSAVNRASIQEHGLDWRHMGATCGIAGATEPEMAVVFLCETVGETDFFIGFRRHARFDVWQVDVSGLVTEPGPTGWLIHRQPIPPHRLQLLREDIPAPPPPTPGSSPAAGLIDSLVIRRSEWE
jgi:hypothetical protein